MITKENVLTQLKSVIDPELNVNIVDLGLIYDVKIKPAKSKGKNKKGQDSSVAPRNDIDVNIKMTLTSPGCPLSSVFDEWVRDAVFKIKGVKNVTIDLVWEPAWSPDKMSDEAKETLGIIE